MENRTQIWGSATEHTRYAQNIATTSRKKCQCGCNAIAKKMGMANGVCLVVGCDLYVRRWVRDGINTRAPNV